MMCTTCGRTSTLMPMRTQSSVAVQFRRSRWMGINRVSKRSFPVSRVDGQTHMVPAACRPIIKCGTSGYTGSCQPAVGGKAASPGCVGRPSRYLARPCPIHCSPVESRERETAVQPCLDIPAGFLRAIRRVQSAVGVQSAQPVNEGNSKDASGNSCGTKLPKKHELYPSCTEVSLCLRWMDQEPTPLCVSASLSLLVLVDQGSWRISPIHVVGLVEKIHIS